VQRYVDDANTLLNEFVKRCMHVFGNSFNVFNDHHIKQISEDCRWHGTLEDISCFKYENYLGQLKKLLHAPGKTLPQLVCRIRKRLAVLPDEEPE